MRGRGARLACESHAPERSRSGVSSPGRSRRSPMGAFPLERDVDYPESDGQPLAETDRHVDVILDLRHALQVRYQADPQVYVAANLFLYYVEGEPRKVVSPDVF